VHGAPTVGGWKQKPNPGRTPIAVSVGVDVGVAVATIVPVCVTVGVAVGVSVATTVPVAVGVSVAATVPVAVGVAVAAGVAVAVAAADVRVRDGVAELTGAVGEAVLVASCASTTVEGAVKRPSPSRLSTSRSAPQDNDVRRQRGITFSLSG
jgi:hypothetical protein